MVPVVQQVIQPVYVPVPVAAGPPMPGQMDPNMPPPGPPPPGGENFAPPYGSVAPAPGDY